MNTFEDILNQFKSEKDDFIEPKRYENLNEFSYQATTINISIPSKESLGNAISQIPNSDSYTIKVNVGTSDDIILQRGDSIDDFISNLTEYDEDRYDKEKDSLLINITKKPFERTISIYSFSDFLNFLSQLSISDLLAVFNPLTNTSSNGYNFFHLHTNNRIVFLTKSFCISKNKTDFPNSIILPSRRDEILEIRNNICHFNNAAQINLIPNDFSIIKKENAPEKFETIVKKISSTLLLISLFDISTIESNHIKFNLKGYKSKFATWESGINKNTNTTISELSKIYDWVYSDKKYIDKIGLARNILSIHLDENNPWQIVGNPFYSIKSGYDIYLKDNVQQYINIKGKLSDQLYAFSNKANSIVDNFAANFKRSIWTFVTFFASLIVFKVLSGSDKDGDNLLFSKEAIVLSIAFLLLVIIYLVYSNWEIKQDKTRFKKSYLNVKNSYKDLLDDNDLNNMLQNDETHISDLEYIEKKVRGYNVLWILVILIFAISIYLVSPC